MVGDFLIWFNRIIERHFKCRHDYKSNGLLFGKSAGYKCTKCDKWKG